MTQTSTPEGEHRHTSASTAGLILRELIGWALVASGIYTFRLSIVDYFNHALTIEGIVTVIMGVILFRGGLQLVKVCVAARAVRPSPKLLPDG